MIIEWQGENYAYDELDIDMGTWIVILKHFKPGAGMLSWERAVDDGDLKALEGLYYAMMVQNGKKVPIQSIDFDGSPARFMIAVRQGATKWAVYLLETERDKAEAEGREYKDPDPMSSPVLA